MSVNMKAQPIITWGLLLGAVVMAGCASKDHVHQQAAKLEAPVVPMSLHVPDGQSLNSVLNATGVQIYECGTDKGDATKLTWNFKAPEADLFESHGALAGQKIGKHYAGPTWEGNDGSKVIGQVKASENSTDPSAISWLLLSAKSNSANSANTDSGIFAKTTSIQRLNTSGGKAPTDGCDSAHVGKQVRIPYTAQYYFYN
jgi:hypothetical protein